MKKKSLVISLCILFSFLFTSLINGQNYYEKKYVEKPYNGNQFVNQYDNDILVGTIYFNSGKYKLTPKGFKDSALIAQRLISYFYSKDYLRDNYNEMYNKKPWLQNEFSRRYKADNFKNYIIKVVGYADNAGNNAYNLDLGFMRAKQVAHSLDALGVDMTNAKIASYGENLSYRKSKYYRKAEVWLVKADVQSNRMLLYILLFFGITLIIGGVFFFLFSNKRDNYQTPPYL